MVNILTTISFREETYSSFVLKGVDCCVMVFNCTAIDLLLFGGTVRVKCVCLV